MPMQETKPHNIVFLNGNHK